MRAVLVAVNVHGKPGQAGLLQLVEQFRRQRLPIGENHRLNPLPGNEGNQIDNVWVDQGLTAGDREIIRVAPLLEEQHFFLELLQRFMTGHILA